MGDQAEDILTSFKLTEEELESYEVVLKKFDEHFIVRRNVIFERAKFNQRRQIEGETVDSFITDLHALAEHCNYGTLQDDMIRDRIVVGLLNGKLSEKLQLDPDLTLTKAVYMARQSESVKKQHVLMRNDFKESSEIKTGELTKKVDFVKGREKGRQKFKPHVEQKNSKKTSHATTKYQRCERCGKSPGHAKGNCPARYSVCRKCSKKGHWEAVCKTKTVAEIDEEYAFLGEIETENDNNIWSAKLKVNNCSVSFKIDTGADVTVIPDTIYSALRPVPPLEKSPKILCGPANTKLPVQGCFKAKIQKNENITEQEIFVVTGARQALLGRPAIESLNIVQKMNAIGVTKNYKEKFPHLFKGLGKLDGPDYKIKLKPDAKPYALSTPRRVPVPLLTKVKEELARMEQMQIISKVDEPTEWCAGMVVVPKSNGKVRICVDLTKLNNSILRELHPLPGVDHVLAQMAGAKVFSKLDANSGFWQIGLCEESAKLTTFITPFGRFCFNRLPFGISSAPEHFQKRISQVLEGTEGSLCLMDDILIYGKSIEEHDRHLQETMRKLQAANLTLNEDKCEFAKPSVEFLGHIINSEGVQADPKKIEAIRDMKAPQDISEVRRFLGMVNQLGKFSPKIAELTKPLRDLLSAKNQWCWEDAQQKAFSMIKENLTSTPTLAHYNPNLETKLSTDASAYGLGAVLTQKQTNDQWRPIAYASRALSPTEQRYAQIEKEALGITWASERFSDYLIGLKFHIETDHKPLVPLLSTKHLEDLPARIQRFKMRMMRFSYSISHVPGKALYTADTLSRAPLVRPLESNEEKLENDVKAFVESVVRYLPATEDRLEELRIQQQEDEVTKLLVKYCSQGWPERPQLPGPLKPYWPERNELTVQQGLLMKGNRLVIPVSMRLDVLDKIHEAHQGITKCRERAKTAVWWPGLSKQLEELVSKCPICAKHKVNPTEPAIPSELPDRPWQKVGADLFELKGESFLIVIDYFSRYVELAKLSRTTSPDVIVHLKSMFARHGIPELLLSDNGPQFSSSVFAKFAEGYSFTHITSSPRYPQSNGEVERAVQTIKSLLKKSKDPYQSLMAYRATPLESGLSPAELLMGRKIRTRIPTLPSMLMPTWPYLEQFRDKDSKLKTRQKRDFDNRHLARDLPELPVGNPVWIVDQKVEGKVIDKAGTPRSYMVESPNGKLRRNRCHLKALPSPSPKSEITDFGTTTPGKEKTSSPEKAPELKPLRKYTRSGREIKTPERYKD